MRILQVTNTYFPELKFGGPPQKIHALGTRLAARGHAVRVLTFDSQNQSARETRTVDGVAVTYLPWRGWGLRQWPRAEEAITTAIQSADIVHCYGLYNFLCPIVTKAAHEAGRPYLIEPLGMYQPRARNVMMKRLYHRYFSASMFEHAARIVATSALEFEELKTVVPAAKLELRRNGIEIEAFKRLPSAAEFRKRFEIEDSERVVLFLGRISPVKNLEALLEAFNEAAGADYRLVLAGPQNEPGYLARLRGLVESLGLDDTVVFAGPLFEGDKLAALAAAELLVLPSLSESFGNAAAEAVAAGVPVLLTKTCGVAALIHKRAGLAVAADAVSLRAGLRVMLDPQKRKPLIGRQAEVLRESAWDEPVAQTEKIYDTILGEWRR